MEVLIFWIVNALANVPLGPGTEALGAWLVAAMELAGTKTRLITIRNVKSFFDILLLQLNQMIDLLLIYVLTLA
jgi:hypothetical protein